MLNESTSFLQPVDDLGVLEGKSDLCNFDSVGVLLWFIDAQIREVGDSLLELKLHVEFELSSLTDRVGLIVVVLVELLIDAVFKVELDGVVGSSDSLDIVVNTFVGLDTLNVIKENN